MKTAKITSTAGPRTASARSPRLLAIAAALATALLLAALSLGGGQRAFAHANYESSTPADGETLSESPGVIDVYFTQEAARLQGLPTMAVVNQAGEVIADEPVLDDADRTHISIEVPDSLDDGEYDVIWHTLSDEDGEESQGAFKFFVGEAPGDAPSDAAVAASTPAEEETLAESPAQVAVTFSYEVAEGDGLPRMTVVNQFGDTIADGPALNEADPTRMSIELPPSLGNGEYNVIWHTLSAAGEEAQGAFNFYVGEGPGATATATGGPATAPTVVNGDGGGSGGDSAGTDIPLWALLGGITVGFLFGTGVGVALAARRPA